MKLRAELQRAVAAARLVETEAKAEAGLARRAVALLDLTSLGDDDTGDSVAALCARAVTPVGPVAAVCVWPRFVTTARTALQGTSVKVAAVINFPSGEDDALRVAEDTRAAIEAGADEIDVVLPYRAFIEGARALPLKVLHACREACGEAVIMKVILESGVFPDPDLLAWAGRDAIAAGADFLKTSTGKITPGTTLEAAALLLHTIGQTGRSVGFKASGGIRGAATAAAYLHLADTLMGPGWASPRCFRFGASGLLDALLEGENAPPSAAAKGE